MTGALTRRLVPAAAPPSTCASGGACWAALPLGVALAINELYFRADTLIISLYEPYDQVGLYTLAYRILELTLVFGTVFLTTTFPLMSQAVAHDEPRARRAIQRPTELFVALGAPLVAGGLVLAPAIVELAGGSDFEDAASRCGSCWPPARSPGSTASSATR